MVVQSYTVLVVDKAAAMRRTTNRLLTEEGYRVLEAAEAKEALAVLARAPRVDLVLIGGVGQPHACTRRYHPVPAHSPVPRRLV